MMKIASIYGRYASAWGFWAALAALPTAIGCSSSSSGAPGPESSGAVKCVGTPTACAALSSDQCAAAAGCASGTCSGSALSCATLANKIACTVQQGCAWDDAQGACTGSVTPCSSFSTASTCPGQTGCAWTEGCSGHPAACEDLSETACARQPGCALAAATDSGIDMPMSEAGPTGGEGGSLLDCSHPPSAAEIIDDMEDQTPAILSSAYYARWYTYDDGTVGGQLTPKPNSDFMMERIPGGRCASEYAMRASGSGFTTWGAGFGFDFGYGPNMPDGGPTIIPANGSAYDGIRFWARVGQGSTTKISFGLGTVDTNPAGGRCAKLIVAGGDGGAAASDASAAPDAADGGASGQVSEAGGDDASGEAGADMAEQDAAGPMDASGTGTEAQAERAEGGAVMSGVYSTADCYNNYKKTLTLTTDWVEYKVRFSELMPEPGWGNQPPSLAVDQLYTVAFAIPPGTVFDVWIDDIAWWRASDP